MDGGPIEPETGTSGRIRLLKGLFFALVLAYVLLSAYHTSILTGVGRFLVVQQSPERSDLIVCLAGGNVERGLAAADAYGRGLAPRILVSREEPPDGYALLRRKGVEYPESIDLFVGMLRALGVPEEAVLKGDKPVGSTYEEALEVKRLVEERGYESMILITSPTHTKRAWLTYRKVFDGKNIRILVMPTPYSGFKPENWWKERKYFREVIIEYQKLLYYTLKHFL
ncbi:MAG: YdcF family protein [Deltaproteobacteria bacterium]|nr:YdcF family protein [Deltaproteobacteria bacterium]